MMGGSIFRYIAEKASTCQEPLDTIQDSVKKGYYAGGNVNGQHWLFVDRQGVILEVCSNSRHVASRFHTQKAYFSWADNIAAARQLRGASKPLDFHLFHNVSRDRSICLKNSISGMTVEIDPDPPSLLTCAWVSLPARAVSFPLLTGQTATPACLVNGDVYAPGKQTSGTRELWETAEQTAHAAKERLSEKVRAAMSTPGAKSVAELLKGWAQQQAAALLSILGGEARRKQAGS